MGNHFSPSVVGRVYAENLVAFACSLDTQGHLSSRK
jgi:hypothetical protein